GCADPSRDASSWVANKRLARPSLPDFAICSETCSASIDRHMSPAVPEPKTLLSSFGSISPTKEFSIIASNWVFAWLTLSGPFGISARRERASAALSRGAGIAGAGLAALSKSAEKSAPGAFELASALRRWVARLARDGSAAFRTSWTTSVLGLKAMGAAARQRGARPIRLAPHRRGRLTPGPRISPSDRRSIPPADVRAKKAASGRDRA